MILKSLTFCLLILLLNTVKSDPLMLEAKQDLIHKISKTNLAVFFYGTPESEQYSAFQGILPSDRQLFSGLQFYFIPSDTIKLSKKRQTLFIFRNIEGNEWLTYEGPMQTELMSNWVRHYCFDNLQQLDSQDIDNLLVNQKKGFVLLEFGQFNLLGTKVLLHDFCKQKQLLCGKVNLNSPVLNIVVQLMRADDQPGVPKLAFWDPNTQKFQLITNVPLSQITYEDLLKVVKGRQGLVQPDISNAGDQNSSQVQQDQSSREQL